MSNKPSLRHIDIDFEKEKAVLEKRLDTCILKLAKWACPAPSRKFYDCRHCLSINKTSLFDDTILYTYSRHRKFRLYSSDCDAWEYALVAIYQTIRLWWDYKNGEFGAWRVDKSITYLENLVRVGPDRCVVVGNLRKGWRLKRL